MSSYPLLDVFLTMLWYFVWFLWIFLVVTVVVDVVRSHDLSGPAKAGWTVLAVVLPFAGVFIYMIARGDRMFVRKAGELQDREAQFRAYVKEAAGGGGVAEDLARLAELRQRGVINESEFERAKTKILS
ncbi:SHOCT domain-containing protein [Dactylosporangium aurantiacum]|uniref:SHOCT domain-containing protein n=1 Tax=Dactylosporangium aurantiacum TaxID=35754 RepID=A0A9Q9MLF0_9ACTN|nr:SHOCT domain-containing protein [Dactylosporangium aurantiacum]MDG6103911.1 SHOCT domain-containing protein [Dactylosporangium aurantiacum]UWZ58900.1 SHOCT domain-containing protein [Dactylosporangium aurantiacum]